MVMIMTTPRTRRRETGEIKEQKLLVCVSARDVFQEVSFRPLSLILMKSNSALHIIGRIALGKHQGDVTSRRAYIDVQPKPKNSAKL